MSTFIEVTDTAGFDTVSHLAGEIWREYYPSIISMKQVEVMLENLQSPGAIRGQVEREGYRYFLVSAGGKPIGYLAVQPQKDSLFLSKFYLEAASRGRGHAAPMMAFVESLARSLGLRRITLTTHKRNAAALRAYEKAGFRIVEPVVTAIWEGFVMDDFRLEKGL